MSEALGTDNPFAPRATSDDRSELRGDVLALFEDLYLTLMEQLPPCRERSSMVTRLQEAAFWAGEAALYG
jgi:hypothetical protein